VSCKKLDYSRFNFETHRELPRELTFILTIVPGEVESCYEYAVTSGLDSTQRVLAHFRLFPFPLSANSALFNDSISYPTVTQVFTAAFQRIDTRDSCRRKRYLASNQFQILLGLCPLLHSVLQAQVVSLKI
jgi:hypothetical protein